MRELKIIGKSITKRTDEALEKYLNEIGKIPMISIEDEVDLARKIRQGDTKALNKLVNANLRFVVSVAKQYQHKGLSLSDLINEGNSGMIKAAKKFDETKGFKFISYAVWWIRQSIILAIAQNGSIIRLPLNKVGTSKKINTMTSLLEQQLEREPTPKELSEMLNIPDHDIEEILIMSKPTWSLDAPINLGEDNIGASTLIDIYPNKEERVDDGLSYSYSLKVEIEKMLEQFLNPREAEILKLFYGIGASYPKTLEDIGEKLHLSRERVRQIKEGAIVRLRSKACKSDLRSFLAH